MARIENIEDIETITVHWSDSGLINDELGCDEDGDIEKQVDPTAFDELIRRAAKQVGIGFDKTVLSVKLKNGVQWCTECKFRLISGDSGLLNLLNRGE